MPAHAIISGAGIAGPALAHELCTRGWRTTVVERYPERRDEGQNIDIRGAGREVLRRMGIDDEVRAANTGELGTRFVTANGSTAASFRVGAPGTNDGPTAEVEVLRGELSRILIDRTTGHTDYRFDTQIVGITDHGDRVSAVLQDGTALEADLLVIAEGLHSRTRKFVTTTATKNLGMYLAYATIPRRGDDEPWWKWQHATRSRAVHLRPDNLGTTRAVLTFISEIGGFEQLDRGGQLTILRSTFADVGGAAPRVLEALEDGAPMYFSGTAQLLNPVWSKGRVALLGDAAFCNATFGGAGTSLALIGAYVLAGELGTAADVYSSLTRYQRVMQRFADAAPRFSAGLVRLASPRTRTGIRIVHGCAGLAAGPAGKAVAAVTGRGLVNIGTDRLALPDYPHAVIRTN